MVGVIAIFVICLALYSLIKLTEEYVEKVSEFIKTEYKELKDYYFGSREPLPEFCPEEYYIGEEPTKDRASLKEILESGNIKISRRGEEANLSVYHFPDASMIMPN